MDLSLTHIRVTVDSAPGQTYAIQREVYLDSHSRPFVMLTCHFNSRLFEAKPWVVELKNEPNEDDAPWTMKYMLEGVMQVNKLSNIGVEFQQPLALFHEDAGEGVQAPLSLRNEYELGPTWTDFLKGERIVVRVYTRYYRKGIDKQGNTLPELLWVHAQEEVDDEPLQEADSEEDVKCE